MNETRIPTKHTLPISVPPIFEQAIGYFGDARLIALFFDVGDEAYVADGSITSDGEWDAYELFLNHPLVAPHLRGTHLGSFEEPPTHYLLLDREKRTLSVAPVVEAQRLLREQWGPVPIEPEPMLVVTEQEWEQLVGELMARIVQHTPEQIAADWREHQRRVEALAAWLAEKWEGEL
jgi:hypothetical protein